MGRPVATGRVFGLALPAVGIARYSLEEVLGGAEAGGGSASRFDAGARLTTGPELAPRWREGVRDLPRGRPLTPF